MTFQKVVAVLIRTVSLLKVVSALLKVKPDVIFTVPPLNVQPLQVPEEFNNKVQPAGILMVQLVQEPPETSEDQD